MPNLTRERCAVAGEGVCSVGENRGVGICPGGHSDIVFSQDYYSDSGNGSMRPIILICLPVTAPTVVEEMLDNSLGL